MPEEICEKTMDGNEPGAEESPEKKQHPVRETKLVGKRTALYLVGIQPFYGLHAMCHCEFRTCKGVVSSNRGNTFHK